MGDFIADPQGDRPGGDGAAPSGRSAVEASKRSIDGPPEAPPELTIGIGVAAFTLPAGRAEGLAGLWAKADEDRPGIARKTLMRYNGLRVGAVAPADVEAVLRMLHEAAVHRVGHAERRLRDRTGLTLGLRRTVDPRQTLFLHGLDGAVSARQYHAPAASLVITPAVEPTEPDAVYLDGLPVLEFRTDAEVGGVSGPREPLRDLTLKELLATLPSAGGSTPVGPAGSGRESLTGLRVRTKIAAGGALVVAPRRSATDEPNLGRMLLVEGPADVGVETVLVIGVRVINGRIGG